MTRDEFDTWLEETGPSGQSHYRELLAVATALGSPGAEEAVATAVIRAIKQPNPRKAKKRTGPLYLSFAPDANGDGNPWPRMVQEVTGIVRDQREVAAGAKSRHASWREIVRASNPINGWKRPAPRAE